MRRTSFRRWPCSIARTLDLLGDWWTPLVLREAFFGTRRFDALQAALGLSRNLLARRLALLVAAGLFARERYQVRPERFEYVLTEKGRDLFGVLASMMAWGDRWLDDGNGPPIVLRHRGCDGGLHPALVCASCTQEVAEPDVRIEPGPGLARAPRGRARQSAGRAPARTRAR